jgi:NADP-dependent 3-hydroxy acid dehydrogenase YdfG
MARYTLPAMRAQKSGFIINIGSEAGLEIYEGHGAYGVAKHALVTLGEYIQKENQELGIHVNTICPGVVLTDMIRDEPNLHPEKSLSPDEIADLVLWLVTKRPNVKFGTPILIQTMENPWQ